MRHKKKGSKNIERLVRSGFSTKQAAAIANRKAKKPKKPKKGYGRISGLLLK
jgi:hypothetical protein